ncbi:glycosyltransferase family 2 protein [Myroides odoratimimus]|uniref:glycosyltransferase family 2 protein n=1 Tax=Myroides odoratimimus TaxID=76832 RepID=UPI002DB9E7CD|nr:glycosyltransferase family 2 protein [Myroides odoratimimus]MEC4086894.1 glycosyltransferase family 2 protein [Myroides odoratimimus]
MESILVSIIIPIYNVEQYLDRCIKSVLDQSYENIEVILIDDGSIDSSIEICRFFEEKDERIIFYFHENKGVSYTRNKGIKVAKGEWVCFVDSDDILEKDYVYRMINEVLINDKCDMVINGIRIVDNGNRDETIVEPMGGYKQHNFDTDNELFNFIPLLCLASPISKLFKKSIINQNTILFDERISIGEDYLFTMQYLSCVQYVVSDSISNYIYNKHNGSLSTTYHKFEEEILAEKMLYRATIDFGKKIGVAKNIIENFYFFEFKKHAYRILFSLYVNKYVDYNKSERINKIALLEEKQVERLKFMFKQNSFKGSVLSFLLFSKYFSINDYLLKVLVNKKLR